MNSYRPRHLSPQPPRRTRRGKRARVSRSQIWVSRIAEYAAIVVVALIIASVVRAFLMQAFWIPSGSMKETLSIGDNVLVSRLTPTVKEVHRGDVVVFQDELGWLSPPTEAAGWKKTAENTLIFVGLRPAHGDQHLIKRVIGLGGDHVQCCDDQGLLQINGVSVDEPYLAPGSNNALQPFDVVVPEGKLWVMGDNRNNSADSRAHMGAPSEAFVDENSLVGRVIAVSWPIQHWSNPNHNEVFAAVPNAY
ncbi:MAG: signal peptidase I [Actinomycetaceae bacterium]|nr:signal peptidase I [Actinomycetaceae bacterium]